ncbi:MAG: decarboxylating NADP(+)-dependent phosphogluconate dehydrogenase [Gammaproteobacteria bacterium]|nr:decarboxylating NADP(+)-dependent phosphogluconate dehydrogenase [Gammaproteobacteria bacterium]
MNESSADIALIGLAVMGQNLVMNLCDNGFKVAVYNRTSAITQTFVEGPAKGMAVLPCDDLPAVVAALKKPRRVMIMVRAGGAVDGVIERLRGLLDAGDIVVDLGNSHYLDSERRGQALAAAGLRFVGCGVSGGEAGARHGPSIMPGGDPLAWPALAPILPKVAAQVDAEACCAWLGKGGAGHYVKMVHNGIEYGDMQLIAEAYHLMRDGLMSDGSPLSSDDMAARFAAWNDGVLDSYLIEITAQILAFKDTDGEPLVERILDTAGQKGTGKWTGICALELGIPVSLIGEAVFARCLSALHEQRQRAAILLSGPDRRLGTERNAFLADLEQALYGAKIASYAQGFMLMRAASREHGWDLDYGAIAMLWRGGCIIRSRFLNDIRDAYRAQPDLDNLMLAPFFAEALKKAEGPWRRVVATAVLAGIPVPALAAGLAFYDGYRTARLPANMLQAQRDYFGAHTYERLDRARGEYFHTDWTGEGGSVSAGTYNT